MKDAEADPKRDQATTASLENDLGIVLFALQDKPEAKSHFKRSLDIRARLLGPFHADTIGSRHNYISAISDLGGRAKALELHEQAFMLAKASDGQDSLAAHLCAVELAGELAVQGKLDRIMEILPQSADWLGRTLGPSHPATVKAGKILAKALSGPGGPLAGLFGPQGPRG
ncbi:MAG: tetratricopeptide repeat protein [Deltaproteobacteria bacterium]|nr:tetratricopeptide repeat protein [Deltaproteobacteria bacterium]